MARLHIKGQGWVSDRMLVNDDPEPLVHINHLAHADNLVVEASPLKRVHRISCKDAGAHGTSTSHIRKLTWRARVQVDVGHAIAPVARQVHVRPVSTKKQLHHNDRSVSVTSS
jgi:hypothetical protein